MADLKGLWRVAVMTGLVALAAMGCRQDPDERCATLQSLMEQKQASLYIGCSRDAQCFVTELRVGQFMAVRDMPTDPEYEAAREAYESQCIDTTTLRRFNIFDARCLPRPDAPEYGHCQMLYQDAIIPPELVQDVLANYCNCTEHSDCNPTTTTTAPVMLCAGQCLCETPCRAGCGRASQCSGWESLELGTTFDACAETCAVSADDPKTDDLMRCLAAAPTCTAVSDCVTAEEDQEDADASDTSDDTTSDASD